MLVSLQHQNHFGPTIHGSRRLRHRRYDPCRKTSLHLSAASTGSPNPYIVSSSVVNRHHQTVQKLDNNGDSAGSDAQVLRKHNAKSTVLLHQRFSQLHQQELEELQKKDEEEEEEEEGEEKISEEEKVKVLELSLVRRRTPQFPGSIYIQPQSESSAPPLQRLFPDGGDDLVDDDQLLMKALEIRRKVTTEIFKEAMRGGKFGITYSANLVSMLPDFIDHIMIEAAAMKQLPKFMHSTFNFRAKTFINNSNVVPLIRWLKHNSSTYPQIAKLICMSRGNLKSIRDMAEWLKTIYVKGKYLGVVLVKAGGAVLERRTEELDEIVGYLESNGVRKEWMGFVVSRCPQLLSCNMEEVRTRVNFYLDLGMNAMNFGTMVFDYPKALGFFTLEEMSCKVEYLKEFGLSNEDVGRLLAFKPQLMACSIEERWKPLVKYLYYLGVQRDGMRRILTLKPIVFCVDLEATIVPKVQFLQDIGVQEEAIGGVLVKFPSLITYSLYKKIRPVVIFLITKAGVTQRDIGKVIALGPELLGCSIVHKLEVNLKYLLSLGIPVRQLGEMVADFPMLLKYNLDVLRPKYHYLRRIMVRPLKDLIEFPRFFSYSLEGRIIPRHKIMVESRVNFKLRYMLASTDEVFDKRVEEAVERRRRFESAATNDPNFGTLSN